MINPLYVRKDELDVHLILYDGTNIKGRVHLEPRVRLSDLLNSQAQDKPFLPVTLAVVRGQDGKEKKIPLLIINRDSIVMAIPLEQEE